MATILDLDTVSVLKGMKDEERPLYFNVISQARRIPLEELLKSYNDLLAKADERDKANAVKAERERKAKLLDTLKGDVEGFRLGATASNGDVHDIAFLEEMRERAEGFGALLVFSGIGEDSLPRFTVTVGKVSAPVAPVSSGTRGGGTGAGRPAADAPQPYVDADTGERVTGPVTMWLRDKVSADRLKAGGLLKDDGKLRASGSVIATAAVKAGILKDAPLPEATVEAPAAAPVASESPAQPTA